MLDSAEKLLMDRIKHSHIEVDMQGFDLPIEATLVFLSYIDNERSFRTTTIPFTYDRASANTQILHTSIQTTVDLFKATSNYIINIDRIQELRIKQIQGNEVNVIPISLLSSPKAYLILPLGKSIEDVFSSYHISLGEIMQTCLLEVLEARYLPEFLYNINTEKELISDFSAQVANWICPCSYKVGEDSPIFYLGTHLSSSTTFILNLPNEIDVEFTLPSHDYPVEDQPDKIHEVKSLLSRKVALKSRLETSYCHLIFKWNTLREKFLLKEEVNRALIPLNQLLDGVPYGDRGDDSQKIAEESKEYPEFGIYKNKLKNWRIYFKGKDCSIKTSKQGLTILQLLFSSPRDHFSTDKIADFLEQRETGYDTKYKKARTDEYLDVVFKEDVQQSYHMYIPLWNQIKKKAGFELTQDNLAVLKYFFEIVYSLLQFEYTSEKRKLAQQIKNKINEANLVLGTDENFTDELAIIAKVKKTGNQINRLNSYNAGINKVIKDLKEHSPELSKFITSTIIRRNYQCQLPEHKPFMYDPEQWGDASLHSIYWKTSL